MWRSQVLPERMDLGEVSEPFVTSQRADSLSSLVHTKEKKEEYDHF